MPSRQRRGHKHKRARSRVREGAKKPTSGKLELGFGFGAYSKLAVAGLFGLFPAIAIIGAVAVLLRRMTGVEVENTLAPLGILGPFLIPILILHMRQPRGARLVWDDLGSEEQDGRAVRMRIAWQDVVATHFQWDVKTSSASYTRDALQIVGRDARDAITVWSEAPKGAPSIRRSMSASTLEPVLTALDERAANIVEGPLDGSRIDWGSRPPDRVVWASRWIGYLLVTIALVAALDDRFFALFLLAVGAPVLSLRVLPT